MLEKRSSSFISISRLITLSLVRTFPPYVYPVDINLLVLHYVNNEVNRELFVILGRGGVEVGVGVAFVSVNLREGLYALRELCSVENVARFELKSLYEIFLLSRISPVMSNFPILKRSPSLIAMVM